MFISISFNDLYVVFLMYSVPVDFLFLYIVYFKCIYSTLCFGPER